ncbi:DUF3089 domain-containing protein [Sphingomicrobium flavum]|uniref:DUF3089 domain-containing protein n=1 Tax=Sphingomicrobium flavum TaxID=1229164 RepID=UPI0021AD5D52|nr:DUF3089 domain-containing protein [Sphingomicrobium flavum]
MCARRFLYVILFLTLLVVAGAFAIFQFGDKVLASQSMPTVEFVEPEAAPEGRYENLDNWLVRPGLPARLVDWRPEEEEAPTEVDEQEASDPLQPAAVFYVHPTTYLQRDRWNAPVELEGQNQYRTELFLRSQASAFADHGVIWAPRYRQAAFGAFLSREEDALRALDVAYGDVVDAFDQFMADNPEGPIVIAGHSQGSLHLLRLLAEHKPDFGDRLVAAYLIGWAIDTEADLPATGLGLCASADETGCIKTWLTFAEPAKPDLVLGSWVGSQGYAGQPRQRERLACTNPTAIDGASGAALSLIPDKDFATARLEPTGLSARCTNGLLLIDGEVPDMGPYVLPGNNYHAYDYALFWGNIRSDLAARHAAYWGRP